MSGRTQALWRVWAFLWAITVAAILTSLVTIIGFVWGIVDVLWQLVMGGDGLSAKSRPATIVIETLQWDLDLLLYSITGTKQFRWLPSW